MASPETEDPHWSAPAMEEEPLEAPSPNGIRSFDWRFMREGFIASQPLAIGTFVFGLAFGVLAAEKHLPLLEALLMSALVYSGSAQLAALQIPLERAFIVPLFATIVMMNARYVLYGAALRPQLADAKRLQAYGSLFLLGDGNWALAMRRASTPSGGAGFLIGSGLAMYLGWLAGTAAGQAAGQSMGPPERFGFDFLLPAFATAFAAIMYKGRSDLGAAAAALAAAATLFSSGAGTGWTIVGAGACGAAAAVIPILRRS